MPPAKRDPASILDAIIERAPAARAAGIYSFTCGDVSVMFEHANRPFGLGLESGQEPPAPDDEDKPPEDPVDPLNDRATYAGGRVPGFTRPKKETT